MLVVVGGWGGYRRSVEYLLKHLLLVQFCPFITLCVVV